MQDLPLSCLTLPTPYPFPEVPTSPPTTTPAGLTAAQVVKLMNDFDTVKAYNGALYFVQKQDLATNDDAKVYVYLCSYPSTLYICMKWIIKVFLFRRFAKTKT